MSRKRLPATRTGRTHKVCCGPVTIYVTVNVDAAGKPQEMFAKSDEGYQGQMDVLAETASLAMQHGCDLPTILRHWRGHRYDPQGVGQGTSLPDAISRALWPIYAEGVAS
jgi:hypothetical protein